jgi:hypothetical protein
LRTYLNIHSYLCPSLLAQAKTYVLRHFRDFSRTPDFLQLEEACQVVDLLSDDGLNARNEAAVFEAVRNWVEFKPLERTPNIPELLQCVRFGLMSYAYFTNVVLQWPLVDEVGSPTQEVFPLEP